MEPPPTVASLYLPECGCHRGRCTRPWPPPSPAASICLREAPLWVFSRVAALHAVVMHAEPPNDGFCVFSGGLQFAVQDNFCRPRHWPSSLTMFYTQQLLARKGPLGLWWLLGNGRPLSGVQCRCSTAELQHIAGMRQSMPISHARTRSGDECNRQHVRCMPCAAECRRIRLMSKAIPEAVEELINPQYVERLTAKRPLPRTCIELRPITRAIATGCRSRYACSRSSRAGSCAI